MSESSDDDCVLEPSECDYPLNRWLLFYGQDYYPYGGIDDLIGSFDSREDAEIEMRGHEARGCWAQIVDRGTGERVDFYGEGEHWRPRPTG